MSAPMEYGIGHVLGSLLLVGIVSRLLFWMMSTVFHRQRTRGRAFLAGVAGTLVVSTVALLTSQVPAWHYLIGGMVYLPFAAVLHRDEPHRGDGRTRA